MSHKHSWECSDVPGNYYCACGSEGYYNSVDKTINAVV